MRKLLRCVSVMRYVAFSFFFLSGLSAEAGDKTKLSLTKYLLPYIEVQARVGNVVWLSTDQLIFDYNVKYGASLCSKRTDGAMLIDDAECNRNAFLDTKTGKTTPHREGRVWKYENGELTISLKRFQSYRPTITGYEEQLVGNPGKEQPKTIYSPLPLHTCPNDAASSRGYPHMLRSEHGCLLDTSGASLTSWDTPWVYFRSDGKRIVLPLFKSDGLIGIEWINWLNAYLLGSAGVAEHVEPGGVIANKSVVKLMKPDGAVLAVPMNEWGLHLIRPTRAGMIATKLFDERTPSNYNGIYLWREGEVIQIAEGDVNLSGLARVSVGPDGCQVAYALNEQRHLLWGGSISGDPDRLRVIDICKGFNLSLDTNPFVWE